MTGKLHNVQLLRAVAALMVVCVHLLPLFDQFGIPAPSGGVDLFFVISGFIMVRVASDMRPGEFLARRCARVVPLYWVMTLFTFACVAVTPALFRNSSADAGSLVMSLLFIPFAKGGANTPQPLLFVGWTLNYEMFFYALFALGLAARRIGLALVMVTLIALGGIGQFWHPQAVLSRFYTAPILIEFALGMSVALASQRWRMPGLALVVIATPLVMFGDRIAPELSRAICLGLPAAVLLAGAVALERRGHSFPRLSPLGDASYAIYLIHPFIAVGAVAAAARLTPLPMLTAAFIALAFVATIGAGLLIYRRFERPITAALNARQTRPCHVVMT